MKSPVSSAFVPITKRRFLPALRSSLSEFLPTLDCDSWQKWMRRFDEVQGLVRLPRFELTCDTHLRTALEALGMGIAFDPRRARFDTIHPPPPEIHVSDVLHRAFVQVNEAGTEAAALTGLIACFSSEQIQKPPPHIPHGRRPPLLLRHH